MIVSVDTLRKDTVALITQINKQIDAVEARGREMGIDPLKMQDSDGRWPMVSLLAAKATAYNTLVMLQTGDNRIGPRPGRQRGG